MQISLASSNSRSSVVNFGSVRPRAGGRPRQVSRGKREERARERQLHTCEPARALYTYEGDSRIPHPTREPGPVPRQSRVRAHTRIHRIHTLSRADPGDRAPGMRGMWGTRCCGCRAVQFDAGIGKELGQTFRLGIERGCETYWYSLWARENVEPASKKVSASQARAPCMTARAGVTGILCARWEAFPEAGYVWCVSER